MTEAKRSSFNITHHLKKDGALAVEAFEILRDPENVFSIAPGGVLAYSDFMLRNGQLKTKSAHWQDVFFPFIHERKGS